MDLNNILFQAHSGVRWLVILATVVAVVALIIGLTQKRPFDTFAKRFMTIFTRVIEVQWLLGLIVLIALGIPQGTEYRWGHLAVTTVAVVVAHLYLPFRRQPDDRRYLISIGVIVLTLVLVYVGVAALPGRSLFSM